MDKSDSKCTVCKVNKFKYRCPSCRIIYCSVACYKQHKSEDSCIQIEKPNEASAAHTETQQNVAEREDGEISEEEGSRTENGFDQLTPEQLQRLGESESLNSLLSNPHLRDMISSLDQATDKGKAIEGAMQEPIFAEFADACLAATSGESASTYNAER